MRARPGDPSVTLYAPAASCGLRSGCNGKPNPGSDAYLFGYSLICVKGDQIYYEPSNFIGRGSRVSIELSHVISASVEADAVHDVGGLCACTC